MSSFNEDIDEGPNLHKELPFWQEELSSSSFSSSSSEDSTKEYEKREGGSIGSDNKMRTGYKFNNKSSYPGQRGRISNYPTGGRSRDWHPKERSLSFKFRARSVSPHTTWRAEVDWQTFIEFGSEARYTNWIDDHFYDEGVYDGDKSVFELRRKPSSRRFEDGPRRDSMPTVSAAVPGSSPTIPERPFLVPESWERECTLSSTIDEVIPPTEDLCEACRCINPQSLKYGIAHHRLESLSESAQSCLFCVFLQEHITTARFRMPRKYQLTMNYRRVGIYNLETREVIHESPWFVFTTALDPAVEYGFNYMRQLTTTRSEESFAVARAWLADCILGHGKEPRPETSSRPYTAKVGPKLPRMLIDVANKTGQLGEVSLVQTELSGIYEHTALTYCWGQVQGATWLTTKANLESRSAGFTRSSLPQTLQDALVITEKLGLHYAWIDALCIVQDDPEDWEVEGSKMAGIYIGAYVTISASSSNSSHNGIFNDQSTTPLRRSEITHIESELTDGRRSQLYFINEQFPADGPFSHVLYGPLSSRAWCFQERALSPRIIHFTASQMVWECEHCLKFEDNIERNWTLTYTSRPFYKGLTNDLDVRILSAIEIFREWYGHTVPDYARRKLTNEGDKLVAISALAEAIHINSGEDYIAGLWRSSIHEGLLWERSSSGAKSRIYRCPSWSWASQNSGVYWHGILDPPTWLCELLAVEVKSGKHNDFGSVESGYIRLRTWVMPAWAWRTTTPENPEYVSLFSWDDTRPSNIEAIMDDDDWRVGRVFCALISSRRLMVLQLVDLASHIYKRVGISERLKFSRWDDEMKIELCEWYGDVVMQHGIRVDITII